MGEKRGSLLACSNEDCVYISSLFCSVVGKSGGTSDCQLWFFSNLVFLVTFQ